MHPSVCRILSLLVLALWGSAAALHAQPVISVSSTSGFQTVKSFNVGGTTTPLTDTFDAKNTDNDISATRNLVSNNSFLDLVGSSTAATIQIAQGRLSSNDSPNTALVFRLRLADYNAANNTGSAVVLLNNGTTTIGLGANIGTTSGVFLLTSSTSAPTASGNGVGNKDLTSSSFSVLSAAPAANASPYGNNVGYASAAGLDGSTNISANDAYLSFAVLASDLAVAASGFTYSTSTRVTAFTSTGALSAGGTTSITADYIAFNATATSTTNALEFGAAVVPEPTTWVSAGLMLLTGAGLWWRRERKRAA